MYSELIEIFGKNTFKRIFLQMIYQIYTKFQEINMHYHYNIYEI